MKEDELKLLVRQGVLDKYHRHIKKNPESLLSRFYGIFTVKINFMKPISVVVMDNLMGQQVNEIQRVYDLKGSLHKRETKKIESRKTVRKDLNFLRDTDVVMNVSPSAKADIKRRIKKDSEFLKQCGLMDYSLLLIVFSKRQYDEEEQSEGNGFINFNLKESIQSFSPQSVRQSKDLFRESKDTPRKDLDDDRFGPEIKTGTFLSLRPCSEFTPPRESIQLPRLTPPQTTFNALLPRESHGGSSGDLV